MAPVCSPSLRNEDSHLLPVERRARLCTEAGRRSCSAASRRSDFPRWRLPAFPPRPETSSLAASSWRYYGLFSPFVKVLPCIWFLTPRLTSQPFIPPWVCHRVLTMWHSRPLNRGSGDKVQLQTARQFFTFGSRLENKSFGGHLALTQPRSVVSLHRWVLKPFLRFE